jgi:glyoxylate reductase
LSDPAQRPRVLLTHSFLEPGPTLLAASAEVVRLPPVADSRSLPSAAAGCQGILSQIKDSIGADVLGLPGLRIVSNVAVGFENVDVAAATRHGVMVTNTPGVLDETTADFAFALLMAASRRLAQGDRLVRSGQWRGWAIDQLLGQDVHGRTLGVVGFGRIGRAVARRARGFGMRVLYNSRNRAEPDVELDLEAEWRDLPVLLAESDFVSVHVPLQEHTRHLIGARQLAMMKSTAVLVNTARGPVVDEEALVEALRTHSIFAAGIDVFENEPQVHPGLLELDNAVLSPHIGSASERTRSRMCEVAVENLLAGLRGERPAHLVNPEVWGT